MASGVVKGAVILAGGASSRMGGGDKSLKALAGRPLLGWVLARIRPQVPKLLLNTAGDPSRFNDFEVDEVRGDCLQGRMGPLVGVLTGLRWLAESETEGYLLTVPCDAPLLPSDLAAKLAEKLRHGAKARAKEVVLAASGGRRHPTCGLWNLRLARPLAEALAKGVRKVEDFTAGYDPAIAEFAVEPYDPFLNVNRPQDLARAEAALTSVPLDG